MLGAFGPDGHLGYVSPAVPVSDALAQRLTDGGGAEQRFRFASRCVEAECVQWSGSRCGVIDRVQAAATPIEISRLTACAIRRDCRWYAQAGTSACAVCPIVVTDQRPAQDRSRLG